MPVFKYQIFLLIFTIAIISVSGLCPGVCSGVCPRPCRGTCPRTCPGEYPTTNEVDPSTNEVGPSINEVELVSYQFTNNLFEHCVDTTDENVFISPLSVFLAVGLLSEGANGETLAQIQDALVVSSDKAALADQMYNYNQQLRKSAGDSILSIGNEIFIQENYDLNPQFQEVAQQLSSGIEPLDFSDAEQSAEEINNWVEVATNGKITEIVSPDALGQDTRLMLVNAIYFKGNWTYPFNPEETYEGDFYVSDTETAPVQFMTIEKKFNYVILSEFNAVAVELTYANSNISFVIVLPNDRMGLDILLSEMQSTDLAKITDQMQLQQVRLTMPRFTAESTIDLTPVLGNMGMTDMFSKNADLSGLLASDEFLYVSSAKHKAYIKVNEQGSEAAAVTSIGVSTMALIVPEIFQADHPFLYFILDKDTSTILFEEIARTIEDEE